MKRTIADRLYSLNAELESLLSDARLDAERTKIAAERAHMTLVDVEMAAKRAVHRARVATRPRHLLPKETVLAPDAEPPT